MTTSPLFVLGRFPPPLDGQSVATARLADLLGTDSEVIRLNTEPDDGVAASDTKLRPTRIVHYLRLRDEIRSTLGQHPDAPVIWTSISSTSLGHWRDVTSTLPCVASSHPLIAVSHRANLDDLFRSAATRASARRMVDQVDRFVFLTDAISDRCADWIAPEKRFVIPNTIDTQLVCSDAETANRTPPTEPFRVLFLSNMMPEKGYVDVLEAVQLLGRAVTAVFAGAWPSTDARAAFEEKARALDVMDHITITGGISDRTRIKTLLLESDAFVLPTYHPTEAMPLTILEALNAGLPIVSTRTGGLKELIEDGDTGFFVEPQSPHQIAASIQRMMDPSVWKNLSVNARARFKSTFHPDIIRSNWLELLARLRS